MREHTIHTGCLIVGSLRSAREFLPRVYVTTDSRLWPDDILHDALRSMRISQWATSKAREVLCYIMVHDQSHIVPLRQAYPSQREGTVLLR